LNNEDNSLRSIKLGDILKPKEISEVMQFFKKKQSYWCKKIP